MTLAPVYEDESVTLYCGDCRDILPSLEQADVVITDPPYGDTSLEWDVVVDDWLAACPLPVAASVWCFGSMRFWLEQGHDFTAQRWTYAQEVVWEKHNGSGFHADRFKRVHEFAMHWYRGQWADVYKDPQTTPDATARTVRRKTRPTHTGHIENGSYASQDGGPRLMRSVLQVRSEHGRAVHPTQKPLGILRPLIEYSCPPGGVVLDPFAGSGSTLLAARECGRRAVGIEIDHGHCEAAISRLAQTQLVA